MRSFCGRNNLALTVMVPYDRQNNCPFCTSKKMYQGKPGDAERVRPTLKALLEEYDFPIVDVVFTGGEPMADVDELKKLVALVPYGKNVYINTEFLMKDAWRFAEFVNNEPKIKGVNISRHEEEPDLERGTILHKSDGGTIVDIQCSKPRTVVPDNFIKVFIRKPVRINVVLKGQDISRVLKRWRGEDVEVSLRRDFRKSMTPEELRNPYDETVVELIRLGFKPTGRTGCNVCETSSFEKNGQLVRYHKGMLKTSIDHGDMLEYNDLIINHRGLPMYDWEDSGIKTMQAILREHRIDAKIYKFFAAMEDINKASMSEAEALRKAASLSAAEILQRRAHSCGGSDIASCGAWKRPTEGTCGGGGCGGARC